MNYTPLRWAYKPWPLFLSVSHWSQYETLASLQDQNLRASPIVAKVGQINTFCLPAFLPAKSYKRCIVVSFVEEVAVGIEVDRHQVLMVAIEAQVGEFMEEAELGSLPEVGGRLEETGVEGPR